MFSVMSVRHSCLHWGPYVTITHNALDLAVHPLNQAPPPDAPSPQHPTTPLPTATKAHTVGKQAVRILLECFLVLISFCSELLQTMKNQDNILLRLSAWRSLTPETFAYCFEQIYPQTKPRKIFLNAITIVFDCRQHSKFLSTLLPSPILVPVARTEEIGKHFFLFWNWTIFTPPPRKRSLRRSCFYTCLSFCPQGESTWAGTPPQDQVQPPGPGTPPGTRYTPRDQVHPLGPGTPPRTRYTSGTRYTPRTRHTPPGPFTPPQDQVHPQGTRYTPKGPGTPHLGPHTPPWDHIHPPEQCMLGDTGNKRVVCILLECILV